MRRHMEEQHGDPLYCSYPGCLFFTRRAAKLRDHLSNVHHREITTNLLIPSEFRIATEQSQGYTNYFSTYEVDHEVNMKFNATRPLLPAFTNYALTSQGQPEMVEPHSAFNNEISPPPEDILTFPSSVASRKGLQSKPSHLYKPHRIRRRPSYSTASTSSASPSQPQFDSAKESSPDFYSSEQGSTSLFAQWMQCALNVEPIGEFLDYLSPDFRLTEPATYEPTSYSDYSEADPFEP